MARRAAARKEGDLFLARPAPTVKATRGLKGVSCQKGHQSRSGIQTKFGVVQRVALARIVGFVISFLRTPQPLGHTTTAVQQGMEENCKMNF